MSENPNRSRIDARGKGELSRRRILAGVASIWIATATLLAPVAGPVRADETLVVYGSTFPDAFARYVAAFEAENPDIKIRQLQDSGGVIVARVLAERDAPQADVLWDVPVTSLMLLKDEGLLEAYRPTEIDNVDARMVDQDDPPSWFGYSGFATVACFNRIEAGKLSLPKPDSWTDLADPAYRGQISMPSPASSGAGYMLVGGLLDLMGEEAGWEFLDALHENIAFYTHSGSKPCKMAGGGEVAVGISFENAAQRVIDGGAPVDAVLPTEGLFWEIAGVAIVRGTDNPEAAKRFLDWTTTRRANELFAADWPIVAISDLSKPLPGIPADLGDRLYDTDFKWISANRERIVAEWQARYGVKTEAE